MANVTNSPTDVMETMKPNPVGRPKGFVWIDGDLAIRIKERMQEWGKSPAMVASEAGMPMKNFQEWLRGDRCVSELRFNSIMDVLNLCE